MVCYHLLHTAYTLQNYNTLMMSIKLDSKGFPYFVHLLNPCQINAGFETTNMAFEWLSMQTTEKQSNTMPSRCIHDVFF